MKYLVTASNVKNGFFQEEFTSKAKARKRMTEVLKSGFDMASLDKKLPSGLVAVLRRFAINLK